MVRRRSTGVDPEQPGDSFRTTAPLAQAGGVSFLEGVPLLTGQKEKAAGGAAARKARKAGSSSDESATPVRVLFPVYLMLVPVKSEIGFIA